MSFTAKFSMSVFGFQPTPKVLRPFSPSKLMLVTASWSGIVPVSRCAGDGLVSDFVASGCRTLDSAAWDWEPFCSRASGVVSSDSLTSAAKVSSSRNTPEKHNHSLILQLPVPNNLSSCLTRWMASSGVSQKWIRSSMYLSRQYGCGVWVVRLIILGNFQHDEACHVGWRLVAKG